MAHVVKLRVKDTTASTGTGTKVLARTSTLNFRTFDAVMANGDTCDAIVINRSANQWEHSSWTIVGVGGEPALTRLEFKESSTGAPVLFTEGVKDVLMLYPVAGKLDFTARTLKLAPNIIDGTPGTTSAFRFYDDGNGWIGGIGISSGSVDYRSGTSHTWFGGTAPSQIAQLNSTGFGIGVVPTTRLDVMGTTLSSNEVLARIGNASGSRYLKLGILAYFGNQAPYIQSYHTNSDANPWSLLLNPNGGNVGIGTSQPADNLHVSSPSNGGRMFVGENGGARRGLLLAATTGGELASGTPYARIEAFNYATGLGMPLILNPGGGFVGIGVSNPVFGLSLKTGDANIFLAAGSTRGVRIVTNSIECAIEGVDATGIVSFQSLRLKGSSLSLSSLSGDKMFITDTGVGIGGLASAGYLLDVHGNPELKVRFKNWGTTGAAIEFIQDVGGRYVHRGVNYDGRYLREYGTFVETRLSDFDVHNWRNNSGATLMMLTANGLGVGTVPGVTLDVFSGAVTTAYHPIVNLGVWNAAAGAAFTRMYIGQTGVNAMFFEVANKNNVKGIVNLQPFGGLVSIGPYLNTGDQFSVQADYDGHLNSTIYNHSIGNASAAKFNMTVRDRHVSRMLYYKDQWMQEKGIGVTQFYSEFDTHFWRSNAGTDKMILHPNPVLWLGNTGGDPVTPGGGGYLYIVGGALKYKGSSGTVTTLGVA